MNSRLLRVVTTMMTVIIMVGLLGASQTVGARARSDNAVMGVDSGEAPGELFVAEVSEENIELVGHLGGIAQAIEVAGNYAYAGIGPEFAVLDISDPAHVQRVGWLVAEGEVMDIAIQGGYAYLAYRNVDYPGSVGAVGLQVVDIRRPALPAPLAVKEFGRCGYNERLAVQGDSVYFAFTACEYMGSIIMPSGASLYRLDITYPSNPLILDTYGGVSGTIYGLAATPGWLYALVYDYNQPINEENRMVVFDISSPGSMVETAWLTSQGDASWLASQGDHIALAGDYALIAANNGLQVVDASDPSQPTDAGFHYLPTGIGGIYTHAAAAYVVYPNSILILDVTDPLNPVDLGAYQTSGQALDISVAGATAYSANGWDGVEIFDTAGLAQRGLVVAPEYLNDLAIAGGYAYGVADDGFWTLDINDPDTPLPLAYMETLSPIVSIAVAGSFAFLASPMDGIHVIDISDPLAPLEAAAFSLPIDYRQLTLVGDRIYAAAGLDGLRILDASDPYHLEEIGAFTPDYGVNAAAVAGRYAYLAAGNDNLILLDISDPGSMDVDGVYDPPDFYSGGQRGSAVAVRGGIVLLGTILGAPTPLSGNDSGSIWIVDVSEPEEPVEVGSFGGGAPYRVSLEGSRAYVVREWQGLYIYDISNPAAERMLGRYNPSEYTYGMTLDGERVYLYNQSLFVLRYPDPALPSFVGMVSHANGQPYPGVPVSASAALAERVSDMYGAYAFRGMPEGTYTITPSLPGNAFHPPSRTVSVPPSALGQNFTILPEPVQIDFTPGISATLRYTDTQELPTWLEIPGDASATPLTLQVVPTIGGGAPGYAFTGHAFELNASGAGEGAAGFVFNAPLTATIQYSPLDVAVISDPDNLALWLWDGAAWQDAAQSCSPAGEYSRDPANYTLSLPICQTGTYKLMGPTQQVYLPMIPSNR